MMLKNDCGDPLANRNKTKSSPNQRTQMLTKTRIMKNLGLRTNLKDSNRICKSLQDFTSEILFCRAKITQEGTPKMNMIESNT